MKKTLKSGLIVDSDDYYQLLEWKDKNKVLFDRFVFDNFSTNSINEVDIPKDYYSINNMSHDMFWKLYRYADLA